MGNYVSFLPLMLLGFFMNAKAETLPRLTPPALPEIKWPGFTPNPLQDLTEGKKQDPKSQDPEKDQAQARKNWEELQTACFSLNQQCLDVVNHLPQISTNFSGLIAADPKNPFNRDFDGDGIPDRLDWDADNDLVANALDQFPFDASRWGTDQDLDGIADFLDFDFDIKSKSRATDSLASAQKSLKNRTQIAFIENLEVTYLETELSTIERLMLNSSLRRFRFFSDLKAVIKSKTLSDPKHSDLKGRYNPFQHTIELPQIAEDPLALEKLILSLVHELFHSIERSDAKKVGEFSALVGWHEMKSPSGSRIFRFTGIPGKTLDFTEYEAEMERTRFDLIPDFDFFANTLAKIGPHEHFAETAAATFALEWLGTDSFFELGFRSGFVDSAAHRWMKSFMTGIYTED